MLPKKMRPTELADFCWLLFVLQNIRVSCPQKNRTSTTNRKSNTAFLVENASKNIVERFLNKNLAVGIPRWFVSPNFAKAFDRAHWPALSKSLFEQGMISKLYEG